MFSSDPGVLSESIDKIGRHTVQTTHSLAPTLTHPHTLTHPLTPTLTQIAVVVDGGPQLVSWVHNGLFSDGGEGRVFGYEFFEQVGNVNGGDECRVGGDVVRVRVYDRAMRTAELIQNYRGGSG